ncbi:MAG: hypothetical protein AAGC65_07865 [Mucilaginibacter sp.]
MKTQYTIILSCCAWCPAQKTLSFIGQAWPDLRPLHFNYDSKRLS